MDFTGHLYSDWPVFTAFCSFHVYLFGICHLVQDHCLAVHLVKHLSTSDLLSRLKSSGVRHPDHTRALSQFHEFIIELRSECLFSSFALKSSRLNSKELMLIADEYNIGPFSRVSLKYSLVLLQHFFSKLPLCNTLDMTHLSVLWTVVSGFTFVVDVQ